LTRAQTKALYDHVFTRTEADALTQDQTFAVRLSLPLEERERNGNLTDGECAAFAQQLQKGTESVFAPAQKIKVQLPAYPGQPTTSSTIYFLNSEREEIDRDNLFSAYERIDPRAQATPEQQYEISTKISALLGTGTRELQSYRETLNRYDMDGVPNEDHLYEVYDNLRKLTHQMTCVDMVSGQIPLI
jgi:hypothetical protein